MHALRKALPLLAALVGIAAMGALVAYFGAGAVLRSLAAVGVGGFVAVCAIHLVLIALMGLAWRALLPGTPVFVPIWGRLVRDAGSEALPLSQVGGYVLGARAVVLAGVSGTLAAASTIVDVTLEFFSQLAYTALGLIWLAHLQPDNAVARPITIGLVVASAAAAGFFLAQRHGLGRIDRIARILGGDWAERTASGAASLHEALAGIYRDRRGCWLSFLLHLVCWIASGIEAWLALTLAGVSIDFGSVMVIESLLHAIRTVAFLVPNAVGVQEAGYILLGASFGLSPEMALALSLLKRARDLVIALPAIAVWQAVEGGRLWRGLARRSAALPGQIGTKSPPPVPVPVRTRD